MSNKFRKIGAGVNGLSPTDFFIQIDDTIKYGDVIDIYLPNSSLIFNNSSAINQYAGIRISSKANVVVPNDDLQEVTDVPVIRFPSNDEPILSPIDNVKPAFKYDYVVNIIAQDGELINSQNKISINVYSSSNSASASTSDLQLAVASNVDLLKGTGMLIMLMGEGVWMSIPFISESNDLVYANNVFPIQ